MDSTRRAHRRLVVALLALACCAAAGWPAPTAHPPPQHVSDGLTTEDVEFETGDRTIGGTIYTPEDQHSDLPGLVLVAGAGEGLPREVYQPVAEEFAQAGIATLVYDKRGPEESYSQFQASFADLADDAVAAVRELRGHPQVDGQRVGVHGHSEGGWTVIEAADRSPDVAFVVAAAPSALSPERTQVWMNTTQLRQAGVSAQVYRHLGETLTSQFVAADAFRLHGHDPLSALGRIEQPVLGLFAEHDRSTPPGESLELYREALDSGVSSHFTLRVIAGVGHGMEPSGNGFVEAEADLNNLFDDLDPAYVDGVTDWVHTLPDGPGPSYAEDPPEQITHSQPLRDVSFYESPGVQVAAFALLLVGFGSYPMGAITARLLRGRRGRPFGYRWARLAGSIGMIVPSATIAYLGSIMISAGTMPGPVVLGRPLLWLVLQLASVVLVLAAAMLTVKLWRDKPILRPAVKIRMGILLGTCVLFVPWANYWGLFTI